MVTRFHVQYQTFKWNGILVSCDNRELTSRLLPPTGGGGGVPYKKDRVVVVPFRC